MTPQEIEVRLKTTFPDCDVFVTDLTGTENHYEVRVASKVFAGRSRIDQQRLVMDAFGAELKTGEVHALTIKTLPKT
ncbi:MAG: BolA/IbaG family iron-sulfur metabolism protein [Bdellovibrionota bacterium]